MARSKTKTEERRAALDNQADRLDQAIVKARGELKILTDLRDGFITRAKTATDRFFNTPQPALKTEGE